MDFTVGVAAYNEQSGIERLLNFLVEQDVPEIVVYNDGSIDKTWSILQKFSRRPNVRVVNGVENLGYAPAMNRVIREASNDVVVMLDADSLPYTGSIRKVVAPFKDSSVAAVSGCHVPRGLSGTSIVACVNERIYKAKKKIDLLQQTRNQYIHLNGLLFAVRKSVLPEKLLKVTNQDAYLGWLIKRLGYKTVFVEDAKSVFQPALTVQDYLNSRKRVIRGHFMLGFKYGIKEYVWHECRLSDYVFNVLTAVPLYSVRGWLSLFFGVVVDVYYRLYWNYVFRKHPEKVSEYRWEQTRSSKW